jgi:hypothetical protein
MNGVGRDKAVTMSMRRSPTLKSLKLSGLVMRKVDIFTLEHDKLVSKNKKNLTEVLNKSKRDFYVREVKSIAKC